MDYPAAFLSAVKRVLADEGGHSDNAHDAGGDTWFGLARAFHPDMQWPPSVDDAIKAYFEEYWAPFGMESLPEAVAAKVFNILVNTGGKEAIECLQRALVACGYPVAIDGELGPQTAKAAAECPADWLLCEFRHEAAAYYRRIAAENQTQQEFIRGWLRRAYE